MSTVFIDSFDHYTTVNKKWDGASNASITTGGRNGTSCLRFTTGITRNAYKNVSNLTTVTVGFAWQYTSAFFGYATITDLQQGASHFSGNRLRALSDGTFSLWVGTLDKIDSASGLFNINEWHYLEFQVYIHSSAGYMKLNMDGTQVASVTGINTDNNSTGNTNRVLMQGDAQSRIDDLYIVDTASFWGDTTIAAYYPNADGTYTQWTPSTGTTHYNLINENPPNLTDYVSTATPGSIDTYKIQTVAGTNIKSLQQVLWSSTDASNVIHGVISSGSLYFSNNIALSVSDFGKTAIWDTNPSTGLAWTASGINAAEFGESGT